MTSKIYKPHINGKPKRPRTHWYHYLGLTVSVEAEKLDLTFDRFCFSCNFQTVRNLQKGTTEMSSGGPKMVERNYGVVGNGRKIKKLPVTHGGRRRSFAGPIPAHPAAVGREISRTASSGCPSPNCPASVH